MGFVPSTTVTQQLMMTETYNHVLNQHKYLGTKASIENEARACALNLVSTEMLRFNDNANRLERVRNLQSDEFNQAELSTQVKTLPIKSIKKELENDFYDDPVMKSIFGKISHTKTCEITEARALEARALEARALEARALEDERNAQKHGGMPFNHTVAGGNSTEEADSPQDDDEADLAMMIRVLEAQVLQAKAQKVRKAQKDK
jgi:hypothetical protein